MKVKRNQILEVISPAIAWDTFSGKTFVSKNIELPKKE